MRRLVTFGLALAVTAVAGCNNDEPAVPEAPERAATWESRIDDLGPTRQAGVVGDSVVVQGDHLLAALDRSDGKLRWKQPLESHPDVRVTSNSVVVYDGGSVTAYDVRTGKRGFTSKTPDPARSAVSTNAVFVHSCEARTCTVVAQELPGGAVRWRYKYARPVGDVDPIVEIPGDSSIRDSEPKRRVEPLVALPADVVEIRREGGKAGQPVSLLNAATGKVLGSRLVRSIWARVLDGRTGLFWRDTKACDVALTGYDVATGKQLWTHPAGRWNQPETGRKPDCDNGAWTPAIDGRTAAVNSLDRKPQLIELDTGKVRWTGAAGVHGFDLTPMTVLARAGDGSGPLVGLDTADGRQRWQVDLPSRYGAASVDRSALIGSRLAYSLTDSSGDEPREVLQVRNAQTGEAQWTAAGSNWTIGVGPDWIVTAADGAEDEGPKLIRLYAG